MSKTIFKDCVNIAGVDHQNNYNHKTYHFANYENNLKVGDKVLTNNGCGMAISTVVEILDNNETAPCVTNQIVCKLDTTAFDERIKKQNRKVELEKLMKKRAKEIQEKIDYKALAQKDSELLTMLTEYENL